MKSETQSLTLEQGLNAGRTLSGRYGHISGAPRFSIFDSLNFRGIPTFVPEVFGLCRTAMRYALPHLRVHRPATGPAGRRRPKTKLSVIGSAALLVFSTTALPAATPVANHPPMAVADRMPVDQFASSINALADDRDLDGDRLHLVGTKADQRAIAYTSDGLITYLADPGTGGDDELFYTVGEAKGAIAIGLVRLRKKTDGRKYSGTRIER